MGIKEKLLRILLFLLPMEMLTGKKSMRGISPMLYVLEMSAALIATAFIVPIALTYLFNLSNWEGVPVIITTLGTTVLAVFFMLGLFIKFMPQEIRSKVGI